MAVRRGGFRTYLGQVITSHQDLFLRASFLIGLLALWEAVGRSGLVHPVFLPYPTTIATGLKELIEKGELLRHLRSSFFLGIYGLGLAMICGVSLGIAMGWFRSLKFLLDPYVIALYLTPTFVFVPLFLIWFGIGITPKLVIVFTGAFFPFVINSMAGIESVAPVLIEAAKSFGANQRHILLKVVLPSSIPFIVAGFDLALARAIVSVVVAEFFIGNEGIGYLLAYSGQTLRTNWFFAALIILMLVGVLGSEVTKRLERRMAPWQFR